jgi:hypothetical protein
MEAIFVNNDALRRIDRRMEADAEGLLSAFDSHRDLTHATAVGIYNRACKGSYELIPADF